MSSESSLVSENPSMKDKVEHVCWHLNQHQDSQVSVDRIAEELGLEWGEAYNIINLIIVVQNISPEISKEDDVSVGSVKSSLKDLFDDDVMSVVSHIFFYNRLNGEMTDSIIISEQEILCDNYESLEEAEKLGWVEISDGKVSLTPTGISVVGTTQSGVFANF